MYDLQRLFKEFQDLLNLIVQWFSYVSVGERVQSEIICGREI